MKQFFIKNQVIISAVVSALILVIQQFQTATSINYIAFGYACLLAVLGVVANEWKLQGTTILGMIGTAAYVFTTTAAGGNFAWPQFLSSLSIALLTAFTSEFKAAVKPAAVILICCLICSCSPAKMVELSDTANSELKAKWAVDWAKANPCNNDTVTISSGHDTINNIIFTMDTAYSPSLYKDSGFTIERITKAITKTITITITITNTTKDLRQINALTNAVVADYKKVVEQTASANVAKANASKFKWMFWILVCAVIGTGVTVAYLKILPKHFA